MKVKLGMFRIPVLAYAILVGGFALRARACVCDPPCSVSACESCVAGVCVEDCGDCDECFEGSCIECFYGGECTTCQEGSCEDDDDECEGECHDGCSGGSCVDDNSKCNSCQECSWGDCIVETGVGVECGEDTDCETEEYCDVDTCRCVCDGGSCWAYEYIGADANACSACQPLSGCDEGLVSSWMAHTVWVSADPGESGYCKNPEKTETIGWLYDCETNYDVSAIGGCAIGGTLCVASCVSQSWPACVACITSEGLGCVDEDGWCKFIDECEDSSPSPIEAAVVDFEGDWSDVRKCGS